MTTTRTVPKVVTAEWLRSQRACGRHVERFEAEWPDGAGLTPDNLARAAGIGLDLDWLAARVLAFPAWLKCRRAANAAWDAFDHEVGWLPIADPRFVAAEKTYRLHKAAALAAILCPEA